MPADRGAPRHTTAPARRAPLAALTALALLGALPGRSLAAAPVLHLGAGTGACAQPRSPTAVVESPCWLQLALSPAVRLGRVEAGLVYEGRDLLRLLSAGLLRPPSVTLVGGSAGLVFQPGERWRLQAAAEGGWRRYADFAGRGVQRRAGAIDVAWLGGTARAGFGLRPREGRTDRLEVSLSVRRDRGTGHATVDGVPWRAGGWSAVLAFGLISEW